MSSFPTLYHTGAEMHWFGSLIVGGRAKGRRTMTFSYWRLMHTGAQPVPPSLVKHWKEYYKNPERTAETIKNGWLYAGDLARMESEGFIYLVDRKKDVVITGGDTAGGRLKSIRASAVSLSPKRKTQSGI